MPFSLKNAGVTYQRMVNKVLKEQIGRNMECYVDKMIVKSLFGNQVNDLTECFETMIRNNIRINPNKCNFGVASGKFLGYLVSARGIEADPEKIQVIIDMEPPKCIKDIQRLTGRMTTIRRFIWRSVEKALPFFTVLKRSQNFTWGLDCHKAFEALKEYLSRDPRS